MSRLIKTLDDAEITRLLKTLQDDFNLFPSRRSRTRNHTIATLMLEAGLRVGEVVCLQYHDLYLLGKPVTLLKVRARITKTRTSREIPCSPSLLNALVAYRKAFFPEPNPNPICPAFRSRISNRAISVRQIQRILTIASGCSLRRHVTPHMLRHTFGTRILRRSNLRVTQILLGHANIRTTQIYTHPNGSDFRKAVDFVD